MKTEYLIAPILLKRVMPAVSCALAAVILSGCSDPADNVAKSAVGEAAEATPVPATAKPYTIEKESTIGFVGSKVTGSHEGGFNEFDGTLYVVDGMLTGSSMIEIDMTSTWSDNDRLTGHLKSSDFFDVETHPTSIFTLTEARPEGDLVVLTGNLALHGVTNSISFPAQLQISDNAVSINAEFAINRKDFNINYPGKPDDLIRDNVVLKLAVAASAGE
jgi:polyisoprenoid-binding protein YceI